jgi:hypothetical protein
MKPKTIRIPDEAWAEFGKLAEAEGSDRSTELRRYVMSRLKANRELAAA